MKKLKKDITRFVGAGIGLGIGTSIVARAETGSTGASVLPAFSMVGSMMRPVGTAMMGMHTLRIVNKSFGKKRMRRRR